MKIDETSTNMTLVNTSKEAPARRAEEQIGTPPGADKKSGSGTEVDFSKTSVQFSRAAEILEKDSIERARRVNELRTEVEEGTYQVDAGKVADKLLGEALAGLVEP